ncbi:MAG: hypothetical protein ACLQU3_34130 [Limisphaerales bacterium]
MECPRSLTEWSAGAADGRETQGSASVFSGLDADDWQHLTGTFNYGSGDTKAELDEIIARSRELW